MRTCRNPKTNISQVKSLTGLSDAAASLIEWRLAERAEKLPIAFLLVR
jgi:hypothetical protein